MCGIQLVHFYLTPDALLVDPQRTFKSLFLFRGHISFLVELAAAGVIQILKKKLYFKKEIWGILVVMVMDLIY